MFSKLIVETLDCGEVYRRFFNFTGVGIEALTYEDMEHRIDRWISDKSTRSHHIACLNAYCVSLALLNTRLRDIYNRADIAGPDGMPFVRWIRRIMNSRCDRFAAPDIAIHLAERSKDKGYTFYLYGGAPDVLKQMQIYLVSKYPHVRILGAYSPPFRNLTEEEDQVVCNEINRLKPDIILVGLGTPKQDYWIDEHVERLKGSVIVASGATFDFFGGRIKMAPQWIRESGFEWLYRLLSKDFLRLWKRYTYYNLLFLFRFALQLVGVRKYQLVRSPRC
ncbi:MAG: WecB/TagA/CpsF family glycosyltransferase [Porticoccus sp.]|uniref:WecB/TagA/CpsF family glycosyltransferase n=1 Tax=Porticoccus sp. TaxID=2024853 RepID=UPI0032998F9A